MPLNLSNDQQTALANIMADIARKPNNGFGTCVLTGSAGTGKTTTVQEIIETLSSFDKKYHLTATTHKAAKVLSNIVGEEVTTVHNLFNLRPSVTKSGVETILYNKNSQPNFRGNSVIIIDEASMVNTEMFKVLAEIAKNYSLFLLFVGDGYQLPPTTGKCPIFDGSLPTYKLTTIHRQNQGNPILDKAIEYRDYIDGTISKEPTLETIINSKGEGIHVLDRQEFCKKFVGMYLNYDTGAEVTTPLCTFTNASAINYNNMVRNSAYLLEDTIEPFYKGERLVSNTAVIDSCTKNIILTNNEEIIVKYYTPSFHRNGGYSKTIYEMPIYKVGVQTEDRGIIEVQVPRTTLDFDNFKKFLKKNISSPEVDYTWVDYYATINSIADLRPPFAGTTHKAQGGTFDSVFIDKKNIDTCIDSKVRARLMYVALTRARKDVYINA